jgi:molecular chaperone DnaJ
MTDLYTILQVHRDAEAEVIRAAHRALARKHHPDFGGDAKRMAAINLAWSILGNPTRRARYDAGPQSVSGAARPVMPTPPAPTSTAAVGDEPVSPTGKDHRGRRLSEQRSGGTVLDFGRYVGWSIGTLADQDPNYLRWLARTPIGRRLTAEIDAALGMRTAEAAALRPHPVGTPRRQGLFASLGTIRTASR